MKNKNFLKKLAAGILGFVMTLGVGAAGYAGAASETHAASTTYTFDSKSWGDATSSWTSGKAGNGYTNNQGVQVTSGVTGANATTKNSFSNVSKIVINYCTNAKAGKGTIKVKVGDSGTEKSYSVTAPSSGGTTLRNTDEFVFNPVETGKVKLTVECGTNSIYINSCTITTTDAPAKTLESIAVKTEPTKTAYDEGEYFNPSGLVITKTYSDLTTEDLAYAGHTSDFTFSPSTSTALTTSNTYVTITVGGKSVNQNITVNALPKYTVKYNLNGGTGSSFATTTVLVSSDYTIPSSSGITCPNGKQFKNWSGSNGQTYSNNATIEANTIQENTELTLTAQYEDKTFNNTTSLPQGNYYIAYNNGTKNLYMSSVSSGKGSSTENQNSALLFSFTLVGDDLWEIKCGTNYLNITNDSKGLTLSSTKSSLKIAWDSESSKTRKIGGNTTGGRFIAWYASGPDFRTYTSGTLGMTLVSAVTHELTVSFADTLSYVGDSTTVTATCSELDAAGLTFTSSDSSVLSVNGTTVTAVGTGSATISASSTCGGSGTSSPVTISARSASIPESKNVDVGADSETLSVTWNPSSPVPSGTITYLWSTTNSDVASLSSTSAASPTLSYGTAGFATISCKVTVNGKEFTTNNCSVKVTSTDPVLSWVDDYHPTTGYTGVSYTFKATQQNINNTTWSWKVDGTSVSGNSDTYNATFDTATSHTVSVTCSDSQNQSITKTITESISIDQSTISISFENVTTPEATIDLNGTFDITPKLTVTGEYQNTQSISVSSDDVSICGISSSSTTSGNKITVTGNKKGTTYIRFNTTGATEVSYKITVSSTVKDKITAADLQATDTGYKSFADLKIHDAYYDGASSKQTNGNIGVRTSSNSGIISKVSGGTVNYVEVDISGFTTKDRFLDIYGSNDGYSSIDDLFDDAKKGTLVGYVSSNSTDKVVRITFNGSFAYVGIRSRDSAFNFAYVEICWSPIEYGTTQSIEVSNQGNINYAINDRYSTEKVVVSKVDEEGHKLIVQNSDLSFSIANGYTFTSDDVPSVTNTITFIDENSQIRTASIPINVSSLAKHELVTYSNAPISDWSGKYLITAKHPSENTNLVLNSALPNIDEGGAYANIEPTLNIIQCGTFYEVEIKKISGTETYSIKLNNGKYMAGHKTSTENGFSFDTETPLANSISIDSDGFVHITSNSKELLFNQATSADRFRYYKNETTDNAEIKLYKYVYEESDELLNYIDAVNSSIDIEKPSIDVWNNVKTEYFDGLIKGEDLEFIRNTTASNASDASDASKAMFKYDHMVSYFKYIDYLERKPGYHQYSINWVDSDGETKLRETEKLEYGATPTAPADPTKDKDVQYTYTFAGWATSQGGTVLSSIPNVTADATYYAVYSTVTNKYDITFKIPYASGNIEVDKVEYGTKPSCSVIPTKEPDEQYSYKFAGWSTSTTSETIYANDNLPEVTGDQTYYARFTPTLEKAKVTFMNGDKKFTETLVEVGKSLDLSSYTPTKDGHTLTGWVDQDNNSYAASASIQNISKDLILTAVWDANSYTITFDVNGGNPLPQGEATKTVTYNTALGELPTPTRDHYVFVGWFTAKTSGSGTQVNATDIFQNTKDTTYYAQWSYVYDIVLDVNADDAQGGALSSYVYHVSDENQEITVTDPTREGYHLTGYKVTDDLEVKNGVLTIPANKGGKITLTAQWEANPHTVTLKYSDSDVQVINTSYDAKFNLSEYARTEEGSYMVWKDQNGNYYDADEILTIKGDLVLTAEWRDIAVSIDADVGFQFTGLDITKFEFIFTGTYDGDNVTEYGFLISKDETALNNCVSANATEYDGVTTFVCDDGEAECVAGVKTENSSRVYYVTFYMIDAQGTHYTQVIAISIDEYLLSDDFDIESIDDPYAKLAIQVYIASLENNVNQGE